MQPADEKQITRFAKTVQSDIAITLTLSEDRRSLDLLEFAERLRQRISRLSLKKERGEAPELPAILVGPNLRCHFIPRGTELTAFLSALAYLQKEPPPVSEQVRQLAEAVHLPADLRLYVSDHCPFCPGMLAHLIPLPFSVPHVRLSVIDPAVFPELAQQDGIRSVPTLILDDKLRWSGMADTVELRRAMESRDPAALGAASLDMLLKDGQAARLAEMMVDSQSLYPAFLDLLFHPSWSTRLGAMVVAEQIIETDPDLAGQICQPIWERFGQLPATVQGDMLYLIGELGRAVQACKIQTVLDGSYGEEVKEAAREALAKLRTP